LYDETVAHQKKGSMTMDISLDTKLIEEMIAIDDLFQENDHSQSIMDNQIISAIVERALREYIQRRQGLAKINSDFDIQSRQEEKFDDLLMSSMSSLSFWDNEIDDAEWNNA